MNTSLMNILPYRQQHYWAIMALNILVCGLFPWLTFAQNQPHIIVLGIAQDGGYPHPGCQKECCQKAWSDPSLHRHVASLALVNPQTKQWWLFEATPDISEQLQLFQTLTSGLYPYLPAGVFVSHAHIGHYTGLMYFGREAMNSHEIPVYTLPKMRYFLDNHAPWSQLIQLKNIVQIPVDTSNAIQLCPEISVRTFTVPHRDELSETAGFLIKAAQKTYLFIPDIDKWEKWHTSIVNLVQNVDVAFLDATFYHINELPGRNIGEVPHPLVTETMALFQSELQATRSNVVFIHCNHTNVLLYNPAAKEKVRQQGFRIAVQGERY